MLSVKKEKKNLLSSMEYFLDLEDEVNFLYSKIAFK